MRSETLLRALFVLYCAEVGFLLVLAPWSSLWERAIFQLPVPLLYAIYLHPVFRGAISGLGLIHLVWGAHDLEEWLTRSQAQR